MAYNLITVSAEDAVEGLDQPLHLAIPTELKNMVGSGRVELFVGSRRVYDSFGPDLYETKIVSRFAEDALGFEQGISLGVDPAKPGADQTVYTANARVASNPNDNTVAAARKNDLTQAYLAASIARMALYGAYPRYLGPNNTQKAIAEDLNEKAAETAAAQVEPRNGGAPKTKIWYTGYKEIADLGKLSLETHDLLADIITEYIAACDKFPGYNSVHEAYAVIKEEVDEAHDALDVYENSNTSGEFEENAEKLYRELVQLAVTSWRGLEMFVGVDSMGRDFAWSMGVTAVNLSEKLYKALEKLIKREINLETSDAFRALIYWLPNGPVSYVSPDSEFNFEEFDQWLDEFWGDVKKDLHRDPVHGHVVMRVDLGALIRRAIEQALEAKDRCAD